MWTTLGNLYICIVISSMTRMSEEASSAAAYGGYIGGASEEAPWIKGQEYATNRVSGPWPQNDINLQRPTCGQYDHDLSYVSDPRTPKIHGGTVTREFLTWQCGLKAPSGNRSRSLDCGCALISSNLVLTAAHCLNEGKQLINGQIDVVIGHQEIHDYRNPWKCPRRVIRSACVIKHEAWDSHQIINDVALILLSEPANPGCIPICLPSRPVRTSDTCFVSGYGRLPSGFYAKELHIARITSMSDETCWRKYLVSRHGRKDLRDYLQRRLITCAGGGEGSDACYADSGGPMFCKVGRNQYQLQGIVSWGDGCAEYPGVYANVHNYKKWIHRTANRMECRS